MPEGLGFLVTAVVIAYLSSFLMLFIILLL